MTKTKRQQSRENERLRKIARSYVGRKFVLWNWEPKDGAYVDQMGVARMANVINREVKITVVDVEFDPRGKAGSLGVSGRFVAAGEDGTTFYGSMVRGHKNGDFWSCPEHQKQGALTDERFAGEYHEVTACYGRYIGGYPFVGKDGLPPMPKGIYICTEHRRAFMPDDPYGCFTCHLEKEKAENAARPATAS